MAVADVLTRIDTFLLDRAFQPLADRLGDKPSALDVGISLELGAVVLLFASDAALFAIGRLGWREAAWDGFSCACGVWFYAFMNRLRPLVRSGHANPIRLIYRPLRLLALGFTLWSIVAATLADREGRLSYDLSALSNLVFVAGMYLVACQPRPPGWRVALRAARRRHTVAAQPAPSF